MNKNIIFKILKVDINEATLIIVVCTSNLSIYLVSHMEDLLINYSDSREINMKEVDRYR